MKKRQRIRVSAMITSIFLAMLTIAHPAASREPVYSGGVWPVSAPLSFDTLQVETTTGLTDLQASENRVPGSLPLEVEDADVADASVAPVSYEVFAGDDAGLKPLNCDVGSCTVTPYGILWGDMIFSTSRTYPGHFILWIPSEEDQGEEAFVMDVRRSRAGINIAGPSSDLCGGITSGGKIEIDFFGGFTIPNTTDVRLRHVYWEAKGESTRMLVGQTWDLISPLLPSTINFSVGWATGNIGFRRAQFRLEKYYHLSDNIKWTVQGALAQNIVPDLSSGLVATGVNRETPNWPMIQGRTALSFNGLGHSCQPITVGVSGHIGQTGFDFNTTSPGPEQLPPEDDARFQTWSFNVDVKLPVTERLAFQGEFFTGANLSNELGGIVQGICPCLRVPIRATGGWGEVAYDVTPNVHTHFGFGVDDPNNADSLIGRTYNRSIYGNVMFDLTEHLRTGFEVASWRTQYHNETLDETDPDLVIPGPTAPGEAMVYEWTVQYRF